MKFPLAVPVILILQNEEAAVVTAIDVNEEGKRLYTVTHTDGLKQQIAEADLAAKYLGYCWFIKPKVEKDIRPNCRNIRCRRAGFSALFGVSKILSGDCGDIYYQFPRLNQFTLCNECV